MSAVNEGIEERLFSHICETNAAAPFYRLVGIKTRRLGEGWAEMSVVPGDQHGNPLGVVHGGVVSTLADAAMGNAIRTLGVRAVTAEFTTAFLNSAPVGSELVGYGTVLKKGKNLVYARAEVRCGNVMAASSQGTFFILGEIKID